MPMQLDTSDQSERIVFVDVGASGGLQPCWAQHPDRIQPVLFEPNPAEAVLLRRSLDHIPGAMVLEHGLSSRAGTYTLHVGRHWGCTSLLEPDPAMLKGYQIASLYDEVGQASVSCLRYDALHAAGAAPLPEVIKLDVEGYEYEVLVGFGALLENCIGIEVESWLYPVYRETRLLGEIVSYLRRFDLMLRRFDPIDAFDRDLVLGNAFFTLNKTRVAALDPVRRRKFDLMLGVWGLPPYPI
jgi:FkbM family methyltransferase